jgi:putative transcriptional regulator
MARSATRGRVNLVRRHRRALELTQAQLAEAVGVSRQTVVSIEAGDYAPSVYLALALAEVLGTTVEALFGAGAATGDEGGTGNA